MLRINCAVQYNYGREFLLSSELTNVTYVELELMIMVTVMMVRDGDFYLHHFEDVLVRTVINFSVYIRKKFRQQCTKVGP